MAGVKLSDLPLDPPAVPTLNCNGRLLVLDCPLVAGILNVTPDSFYAGSRVGSVQEAVDRAGRMLEEGAGMLDVGGMSSRPGAELISSAEETDRVLPVIEGVVAAYPEAVISIDTVYGATARAAVNAGAGMVNDISAGKIDPELWEILPELRVPYVLMHMPGKPADMQRRTSDYGEELLTGIWDFLATSLGELRERGVLDVLVDVGFGFGKTVEQNYELLRNLGVFRTLGVPLYVGISRKSMLWRPLGLQPEGTLAATTALHLYALQQGAAVLRTHDVAEAVQAVRLHGLLAAAPLAGEETNPGEKA